MDPPDNQIPALALGIVPPTAQLTKHEANGTETETETETTESVSAPLVPVPPLPPLVPGQDEDFHVAEEHLLPKSSRKQQARMDGIWYKHLDNLKDYKETHGHVSVPRKSGQLGEWCRTQRRYYKMYRKGETVPLTKERMKALEGLGFVWFPAEDRRKRKQEASLASAKDGDADVPTQNGNANNVPKVEYKTDRLEISHDAYGESVKALQSANEKLCDAQILLEKAMQQHKQSLEEQRGALELMNKACDDVLKQELEDNEDDEWIVMYKQLAEYKDEHGEILFSKFIGGKSTVDEDKDPAGEMDEDMNDDELEDGKMPAAAVDMETSTTTATATTTPVPVPAPAPVPMELSVTEAMADIMATDVDADAPVAMEITEFDAATTETIADTTTAAGDASTEQATTHAEGGVKLEDDVNTSGESSLSQWVAVMRKAPKKVVSEWRHKALDKLGFIW